MRNTDITYTNGTILKSIDGVVTARVVGKTHDGMIILSSPQGDQATLSEDYIRRNYIVLSYN